jgi:uncharacterized membrane protein HdeD (DUF308 family)
MRNLNKVIWVIQGILAIILGIVAFAYPFTTLRSVIVLFGLLLLLQGVFNLVYGLADLGSDPNWFWKAVYGVLGLILAFGILVIPGLEISGLAIVMAGWLFVSGLFEIIRGIALKTTFESEFLLILNGLLTIIIAILMVIFPVDTLLAFTWVMAIYVIVWGLLIITQVIRIITLENKVEKGTNIEIATGEKNKDKDNGDDKE